MKTGRAALGLVEWVARNNALGMLLVGGLVVLFVLGGRSALYDAVRLVGVA